MNRGSDGKHLENPIAFPDPIIYTGSDAPRHRGAFSAYPISPLFRTGRIFKTESVIIPAVLDSIAGAGWVRGMLPILNRSGYSILPLLLARRVKLARR